MTIVIGARLSGGRARVAIASLPQPAHVRMARSPDWWQRRKPDTRVMVAVRYDDGRTAYMRVSPEAARHGGMVIMDIARERQEAGEIPSGTIVSVKPVR